jgi:DNA-binding transcriptional LysR family regulator
MPRKKLNCFDPGSSLDIRRAMNIHHLELFYYVARHGGISRAVRYMPYGIQQPAISSQMLQLEQDLGTRLFERSPFRLTAEGEVLFAFVQPFFDNIDTVAAKLRKRSAPLLRVCAAELVLRDHLPTIIERMRAIHPDLQLSLRSGFQSQMEAWLQDREIDLAITPLESRPSARIRSLKLVRLPLVLVVPRKSKIKAVSDLWALDKIEEPLISLPPTESVSRLFQKGLKRWRVEWPVAIEASSLETVTQFVVNGYGFGVNVNVGQFAAQSTVRALPLDDFDPIEMVVLWHGEPTPFIRSVLEEMQRYVHQYLPQWACDDGLEWTKKSPVTVA